MKIKEITYEQIKERIEEFLNNSKSGRYQIMLVDNTAPKNNNEIGLYRLCKTEESEDEIIKDFNEYYLCNGYYIMDFYKEMLERDYTIYEIVRE